MGASAVVPGLLGLLLGSEPTVITVVIVRNPGSAAAIPMRGGPCRRRTSSSPSRPSRRCCMARSRTSFRDRFIAKTPVSVSLPRPLRSGQPLWPPHRPLAGGPSLRSGHIALATREAPIPPILHRPARACPCAGHHRISDTRGSGRRIVPIPASIRPLLRIPSMRAVLRS